MARRPDAAVTYGVTFFPTPENYSRPVDRVNKRTAMRVAKRLGLGSIVMVKCEGPGDLWSRKLVDNQPAAPRLKNGKRMDAISYCYHYTGGKKPEGFNITPLSEVA